MKNLLRVAAVFIGGFFMYNGLRTFTADTRISIGIPVAVVVLALGSEVYRQFIAKKDSTG